MIVLAVVALFTSVGGSLVAHMQYDWLAAQAHSFSVARSAAESDEASNDTEPAPNQPIDFGSFHEIENMIVNPAESGGSRYLMVNVGFESDRDAVLIELEEKEVVVRDRVINLLSEFTVPLLADIDHRSALKDTLRQSINEVLDEGQVTRLYFTQYVLQ